ncbi:MAG TPA: protein kinase [Gemmatimonadaceae bacterium]|nr:protein kinase [Gemmatimonadaceae bacterium]
MPDPVASSSDAELRDRVGRALSGSYELDREIGRGGMGIVYRARDRRLKRPVAVKILPPELSYRSEIRSRFLREAETAAQLSHPNIVPIYSVDEVDGLVYFVMACIEGENLGTRLHSVGRLGVEESRRILRDVSDALAYAHARRVIHRDIKPDNILLDRDSGRPMVTDFGIARAISEGADSRLTATGMAVGTPAYMSPEQAAGDRDIDGRSDLYSLGIVAYQMLTGQPPFMATSTPALLVKHLTERPVPVQERRADVPTDLARAVMMLLEKDPANRLPSASALVAALEGGALPMSQAEAGASRGSGAALPVPASSPQLPVPASPTPVPAHPEVTAEEVRRWNARPVVEFRRKLMPYLAVNAVIIVASIITSKDFFTISVIWTMVLAYQYGKLWSDGFDWRDVFRQSRDRQLVDVAGEAIDSAQGLVNKEKRREVRERARQRRIAERSSAPPGDVSGVADEAVLAHAGAHANKLRQAARDRDEILRIIDSMPKGERELVAEVPTSAVALYDRIRALSLSLAELERGAPDGGEEIEREIRRLEAEANPFDRVASEERVRRLAHLQRQRRSVADVVQRRRRTAERLESCLIALQSMRYDLVRLRTGAGTPGQVTSLAIEAMKLARDVDIAVAAAEESRLPRRSASDAG